MCDMRNRSLLLLGFLAFGLGMNAKTYVDPATGKTLCSIFDEKREGQLVDTQTSYVLPLANTTA